MKDFRWFKASVVKFQQQENLKFLSHFERKFVIHHGKRKAAKKVEKLPPVELFHLRSNGSAIATRCLQVEPVAQNLNSEFWYALFPSYIYGNH